MQSILENTPTVQLLLICFIFRKENTNFVKFVGFL